MPCEFPLMNPFSDLFYQVVFYRSSGLLIYAALVDLLAEDFLGEEGEKMSKRQKIWAFCFVMMGGKLATPFSFMCLC